nr:MAG TPA: hypothetical protein [Caudoviricetes sp.]
MPGVTPAKKTYDALFYVYLYISMYKILNYYQYKMELHFYILFELILILFFSNFHSIRQSKVHYP